MIELRWLEKPKKQPIYDTGENVRVLQYRCQHFRYASDEFGVSWTDWQDVPTVTEESDVRT